MVTLRCTKKLLDRMGGGQFPHEAPAPTTVLGDWHANLLFTRPQVVLFVNDRTRLPVLVPARVAPALPDRLRAALSVLLVRIGVPPAAAQRESDEMATVTLAKTRDRSVLGTINDFQFTYEQTRHLDPHWHLDEWSWHLSGTVCGPLKYAYPRDVVLELFGLPARRRWVEAP